MPTRRGSQYSFQSNGGGLRSRNYSTKGKRNCQISSGTESTQRGAISQRQVPEMLMISEPKLELIMSYSKRDKHIQRAHIAINMIQYKHYYTIYKDKDREILIQIHKGVMNFWYILKKFLNQEEIVKYFNGWNPLSSKPQKKGKDMAQ
ncbi:hypothetical protein O181_062928 [Austropuccinia psidii MF-1]|uniref:Uncharacterized protein n=1 Tax=Austropuccinia psidii MF-1 TaxID=1389203 RepID=A0A9Q3EQN0_9BASI|nr:hypothetical protein [Austropuccinia psidii MF-1]